MQSKKRLFKGVTTIMALLLAVLVLFSGCDSGGGSSRRSRDKDDDDRGSDYETVVNRDDDDDYSVRDKSSAGSGYRAVINKFVSAMQDEDGEAAAELASKVMMEIEDISERELVEDMDESFEWIMEELEDRVGKNVRLEVTECDFEEYDEDDFNDFIDELEEFVYDVDDITAIADAEVTVNAKGRKKDRDYEFEFIMVKENGDWKIWSFYAE